MAKAMEKADWMRRTVVAFERPLTGYAARITGDVETARDVVQEVFLRLWQQDPTVLDGRLKPWLYTVARNRAVDIKRKESHMPTATLETSDMPTAGRDDPAASAVAREGQAYVLTQLGRLGGDQQEVIRLRFQHGLSYKEIAEVTGKSVGNVGFLMHVGMKALRGQLGEGA